MPKNYFIELGKMLASEMARNPATRTAANDYLNRHLAGAMARDAMPRSMVPRGGRGGYDQDPDEPNGGGGGYAFGNGNGDPDDPNCIDAESCTLFVKKLVLGLDPDERAKFLENLASMMQSDDATQWAGGGGVNASAMDRGGRSGNRRRGGRDTGMMPPANGGTMDRRRQAQDSNTLMLNAKGFEARWGKLTGHVQNWGR